jgi:hypothetical protein
MRSPTILARSLTAAAALVAAPGCVTSPLNGETQPGPTVGSSINIGGFTDGPNTPVFAEILTDATADPTQDGNWTSLPVAYSRAGASFNWNGSNVYLWETSYTPTASSWPQGGLLRVRAKVEYSPGYFIAARIFDEDFVACLSAHTSASWFNLGSLCGSPYPYTGASGPFAGATANYVAALVSTTPSAGTGSVPKFLTYKMPPQTPLKGPDQQQDTNNYYSAINAPANFPSWYNTFFASAANAASAVYYNNNDLGFGREMHCADTTTNGGANGGKACYVRNYGNAAFTAAFPADSTTALALAETGQGYFATVAMVYDPTNGSDAPNAMKFYVYSSAQQGEQLQPFARLDSVDVNEHVPGNCITCHGGSSSYDNTGQYSVTKGRFLAFDVYNFLYDGTSTLAGQQENFRQLNAHVNDTVPAGYAIQTFLAGMYAPNGVYSVGQQATNTFVPTGWQDSQSNGPHQKLYNEVVKPYCRTCHMSHDPGLDWMSFAQLSSDSSLVRSFACDPASNGGITMPHAQQTAELFWGSQARAHLVAGLQLRTACPMPSQYQCAGQTECVPGSTQSCGPLTFPYGCTASQTCDQSTCTWDACVNDCRPFTPDASMPGVNGAAFLGYHAGSNCFSTSFTNAGPWQVCPNGSHIDTISCQLGPGSIGSCSVTGQTSTNAGIEVVSPNNCFSGTTGNLVVTCIAD